MFGGRSNFGNFFLRSPRAREAEETRRTFDRVQNQFRASPWSSDKHVRNFIMDLVLEGARRAGGYPTISLGEALWRLVSHLLHEDGIEGFPVVPSFEHVSAEDGIRLRRYLVRKEQFLADADRLTKIWRQQALKVIGILLRHLPNELLVETEAEAGTTDREGSTLSAPLMDLCHGPGEAIEQAIAAIFDEDVLQAGLFEPTRERFHLDLLHASAIEPDEAYRSRKPLIFPSQSRLTSPAELVSAYCTGTALEAFYQSPVPFAIPFPARFEHTHIVGGSGHGKTQLMQSMIYDDLLKSQEDGRSVVVIDSQGDLINTISHLALFSADAQNSLADRFILVDPTDIGFPICLNLFDWGGRADRTASAIEREKLLNSAISLYEYIFGALLGAELTQKQGVIFKYLARLMLEIPDATIHTLGSLMEDGAPFRPYMERLTGSARQFFATRFFDRSFSETKKQILTRLWGVLSNSTLERIFGNPRNKLNLFDAVNSGKIVLINTAKDLLTQEGAALFGRFFIALISQAALQRAAVPAHRRRPCFVYIDEAADYFDDTVEHLLNQARKYKVGLVLAHQNLDQLSVGLRSSLMASTSIKLAGGVSAKDARALSEEMHVDPEFLQGMRKRKSDTQFACFVRQFTPRAIATTVPLGRVESQPSLSAAEYRRLIDRNRARYCISLEESLAAQPPISEAKPAPEARRAPPAPPRSPQPQEADPETPRREEPRVGPANDLGPRPADTPAPPPSPARPTAPAPESAGAPEQPAPPEPKPAEAPPSRPRRSANAAPAPLGRGGRQHQYIQHLIKTMAEERGWRAVIEDPILDGGGRVDVALIRGSRRIACEISVTSTKDQELGNVEKCLAAGYAEVILIATAERQRDMLQKYISATLEETVREKVRYLLAEEMLEYLATAEAPTEQTIRGYRVKVKRQKLDPADAEAKRQAIAAVIARSLKKGADPRRPEDR